MQLFGWIRRRRLAAPGAYERMIRDAKPEAYLPLDEPVAAAGDRDGSASKPLVSGLQIAPNGASMFVKHDRPLHVAVLAGEPYAHAQVFINGVLITPPRVGRFDGYIDELALFDEALTPAQF